MDQLRTEIWDHLYRTGPQTVEQIANFLRIDPVTVRATVEHEWFQILDSQVRIATGKPPSSSQALLG